MMRCNQLRILQYNVGRNREVTDSILNDKESSNYTLLLLQEQYWSAHQHSSPLHHSWTLLEPPSADRTPRTAIYVNNAILASNSFTQIPTSNGDMVAISITPTSHQAKPTLIINIYNPQDKTIIPSLRQFVREQTRPQNYDAIVIVGDFNLHHPLWNPRSYPKHDPLADELVDLMLHANMNLLLPPGTITYPTDNQAGGTAIDLVWGNDRAKEYVLKCHTVEVLNDHTSDHLPIEVLLDLEPRTMPATKSPFNYAKTNWELLKVKIQHYLPDVIDPTHATTLELDEYAAAVTNSIHRAIEESTPRKRPCPHSKRWWKDDLTALRKEVNVKRVRYQRTRNVADQEEWKSMRDYYKLEIRKAKEAKWRQFIEEADEKTIWTAKKYIDSLPTPYYIPTINGATSNGDKAKEFMAAFFPAPPPANLDDIDLATHLQPVDCPMKVTHKQVERAVGKLSPDKAPGPDEIANVVLKKAYATLQRHLHSLVQASLQLNHFPEAFKTTTTVVLRKPMKPDYTKPNAYRPIALENTLGKVIESVVAEILSYLAETHNLLPQQHFGGCPGRAGEDAMLILSEKLHHAWKEGDTYSVVFMDVAGAFNNVHHKRLLHNLRKRRVPEFIGEWIGSFLRSRQTQLRFNGVSSERVATDAGIPQGSPLSPILYLFYNADLLDIPGTRQQSLGFIDDIAFGAQGSTDEENAEELKAMLDKAERWREAHGARFEASKYVLIHFSRRIKAMETPIRIANKVIQPSHEVRYLGVIFDRKLRFKLHVEYAAKKGAKFALAMSRIAKSTWGTTYQQTRNLFTAVAVPRMDYAAIIWHRPTEYGKTHRPGQLSKLEAAQRTAMRAILGAFSTTATSALEVETAMLPTHLRLRNKVLQTFTRMQTSPSSHPIHQCLRRAVGSRSKKYISVLEYITRAFPEYAISDLETIVPYVRPPWWVPHFTVDTSGNKNEAKAKHDNAARDPDTIRVYTDGSGIGGHIGAAAYSPETSQTVKQHLGAENQSNVYAAELTAMELAVTGIVQTCPDNYKRCIIYADSQAAITAASKPSRQSGQAIIGLLLDAIDNCLVTRNIEQEIVWIPGHMDIEGNETADKAAKEAATPNASEQWASKVLKSARSNVIKQRVKKDWKTAWNTGKGDARQLRKLTRKAQTKSSQQELYSSVRTRQQIAQLASLRTGHCPLNHYLHHLGIEDSSQCTCGSGAIESVEHYLLHCPKYDRQRAALTRKVGIGGMWIEKLLGNPKLVKHTLEFVSSTKRFSF